MPVVDASVIVDCVAPGADPKGPALRALGRLAAADDELLAPRLLIEEASNALLAGVRRRRWSGAEADRAHELLLQLPVRLADDRRDLERAWELARRYDNHAIYDLVYVALAERHGTTLVTSDAALRERLVGVDWLVAPERIAG